MTNEKLYQKVRNGDTDAFEQLYVQLENFIRAITLDAARRFGCTDSAASSLLEDLCAEGNLELWERIQTGGYDEHAGKLTTYLYPFLRGRMYRYLETNLGVMALSKGEMARVRLAQRLYYSEDKNMSKKIRRRTHTVHLICYNGIIRDPRSTEICGEVPPVRRQYQTAYPETEPWRYWGLPGGR